VREDSGRMGVLLTVCPFVDGVVVCCGHIVVCVFPVEVHGVFQIDEHRIRDGSFAPAVAADTSMAVEILPFLLVVPLLVAVPPAILLKRGVVGSVPQMHS
jgi:hypothetical protein